MNVYKTITKLEKIYLMFKFSVYFYLNIDRKTVQSEKDVVQILAEGFNIDDLQDGNWDALADRLERPDYIIPDSINIFINNAKYPFINDEISKNIFLEILSDTVLWWDGGVERYIVGGKRKKFNVYIIE
ncbi:barstar family protein [Streptococcus oralis]|nr:barstar family protein [Streptococcus oralis]